jgi:uncharacterized protein (DUF433 family)
MTIGEGGEAVAIAYLERAVYEMRQVDRLLRLTPGTALRWIDGYGRAGKSYPPIIRETATGSPLVTWGEFVEASLLSAYRNAGVPMARMRPIVQALKHRFGTRYPLAHVRPWVDQGRNLVYEAQEEVGLDSGLRIVVEARSGQLRLSPAAETFFQSVDFERVTDGLGNTSPVEIAARLYPYRSDRAVVIDPERRSGVPVVRSVPTEILAQLVRAGDDVDVIADWYELPPDQVRAAVDYENSLAG